MVSFLFVGINGRKPLRFSSVSAIPIFLDFRPLFLVKYVIKNMPKTRIKGTYKIINCPHYLFHITIKIKTFIGHTYLSVIIIFIAHFTVCATHKSKLINVHHNNTYITARFSQIILSKNVNILFFFLTYLHPTYENW